MDETPAKPENPIPNQNQLTIGQRAMGGARLARHLPARKANLDFSSAAARLVHAFLNGRKTETITAYRQDLEDFQTFLQAPSLEQAPPACSWPEVQEKPTPWRWTTRRTSWVADRRPTRSIVG